jgi:hypothetical protein
MDTLVVKKVERFWPDDESAEVTLASGKGEMVAFSYPCDLSEGQVVPNLLHGIVEDLRSAYLSDWPESVKGSLCVERLERIGPLGYRGCGRVIDQSAGLVEVLGFILDLGTLPCSGTVEFECTRIDFLWA